MYAIFNKYSNGLKVYMTTKVLNLLIFLLNALIKWQTAPIHSFIDPLVRNKLNAPKA